MISLKKLKKEYYQKLQENQDARIFSITKHRNDYTYQKFENIKKNATLNLQKDRIKRMKLNTEKQHLFNLKITNYNDSIANAIGYRRVSKAIDDLEKKRKLEELRASNKREAFYRSQSIHIKKNDGENNLKSKLDTRHEQLKKKYTIEE